MSNANLKDGQTDGGTNMIITTSFLVLSLNLLYLVIKKLSIKNFSKDCQCNTCRVKKAKSFVQNSEISKVS